MGIGMVNAVLHFLADVVKLETGSAFPKERRSCPVVAFYRKEKVGGWTMCCCHVRR